MEIFVGNWPPGADDYDLRKLFERDLLRVGIHRRMRGLFKRQRREREVYRVVTKQKAGSTVHYGFAVIEPDDVAQLAVQRLHHSKYRGHKLVVREWHTRAYQNDRRALDWRSKPWNGPERRKGERRESRMTPGDRPDF